MESPDIGSVQKAILLIEQALDARLDTSAVRYFAPTDIGILPPSMQVAELRNAEEVAYGNRVRAGVRTSLAASAASLRVCESLMKDDSQVAYGDRLKALQACAAAAEMAAELMSNAAAILAGKAMPRPDSMTEIRRLSSAIFHSFHRQARNGA